LYTDVQIVLGANWHHIIPGNLSMQHFWGDR